MIRPDEFSDPTGCQHTVPVARSRSFRSRTSRVGAFYFVAVGSMALLSTISTFRSGRWPLGAAIAAFGLGAACYGALVLWLVGVDVAGDRTILRGPLGTQVVPLADAQRFELGRGWPWRVWPVRRDGTAIRTTGLGASGFRHRKSMDESRHLVDTLNGLLDQQD
jgi:hypothetical protein